jgi:DNA-binding transcriptional ArsR family regulator
MHPQMKSCPYSKYDVALFIYDHGKTRWTDLLQAFVKDRSDRYISKQQLSNHLKELYAEGLVTKTVDKRALLFKMYWKVYPIYVVPKDRKKRIEEIRTRKTVYEFIDSTGPDNLNKSHEVIRDIEVHERNGECLWIEFLDNFLISNL